MEGLFLEGFILQASLIFALGAQNIFVLESGIHNQHPVAISFACFFCDLVLIMLGVIGAGTLFSTFSQLKILIGIMGVAFLMHYGLSKIFLATDTLSLSSKNSNKTLKQSLILSFTFSVLNPHAYLDAFILIGGYSSKYPQIMDRITVGAGAAIFSLVWFLSLSSASWIMKPILSNPRQTRFVMACSGLVLLFLSFRLGQDVYGWIYEGQHSQISFKAIQYQLPSSALFTSILY